MGAGSERGRDDSDDDDSDGSDGAEAGGMGGEVDDGKRLVPGETSVSGGNLVRRSP